jgi:hypothetical protein
MKSFDFYIDEGKVKRCSKDLELAKSLLKMLLKGEDSWIIGY